jgi:hypothetical protein
VFLPQPFEESDVKPADEDPLQREREKDERSRDDKGYFLRKRFFGEKKIVVKMNEYDHKSDPKDCDVFVVLDDAAPAEGIFFGRLGGRQTGKKGRDELAIILIGLAEHFAEMLFFAANGPGIDPEKTDEEYDPDDPVPDHHGYAQP